MKVLFAAPENAWGGFLKEGGLTDVSMQGIVEVVAENIERLEKGEDLLYVRTP